MAISDPSVPVGAPRRPAVVYHPKPATPAGPPQPRRVVVIEDSQLAVMASQERFLNAFPFLANFRRAYRTGCQTCGGRTSFNAEAQRAKAAFAGLADDQQRKLKELLNTESIEVYVSDGNGKRKVTF